MTLYQLTTERVHHFWWIDRYVMNLYRLTIGRSIVTFYQLTTESIHHHFGGLTVHSVVILYRLTTEGVYHLWWID